MAVIPTGTASLRGVGPRAPAIRSFALDTESLARAATAPSRVAEAIDVANAARRERTIDAGTFEDRRQLALDAAANAVTDSPEVRAAEQLAVDAKAEADRLRIIESQTQQKIAQANQARKVGLAGQQQIVEELKTSQDVERLSGTPTTTFETGPDGVMTRVTGIETPTGEVRVRGREQMDPTVIAAKKAATDAALLRSQAYAKSIEVQAARTGKTLKTSIQKIENPGGTVGFLVVKTDQEGNVSTDRLGIDGNPVVATPEAEAAGLAEIEASLIQETKAAQEAGITQQPAAPVTENGVTFAPTGINVGGYRRGVIYTHPTLGRVVYTGGDPFLQSSFQPIQ